MVLSEFEKDFYNRMVKDFKEYEHLFSTDEHDYINECTDRVMTKSGLTPIQWFNLGVYYAKVHKQKVDNKSE